MFKMIAGISIFLLLAGCTLTASQETALNRQTNLYLKALNEGAVLYAVSRTHPCYVSYAKEKGDAFFTRTFAPAKISEYGYTSPSVEKIEKKKGHIHVQFSIVSYTYYGTAEGEKDQLIAISEDEGKTWFFMPFSIYKNKQVCRDLLRIL